ncbi:uncharacterized protein [Chironomus tepperi]|uniref:uncharacterized protein n=1 Tax=Chironomus tepperi TaxID=113505 RepID=UPI00391F743F
MDYLGNLYSYLFHKRKEEILVESTAQLEALPQEILLTILSYLSANDLLALSTTCRRFSNLINTDDFLAKFTLRISQNAKKSNWIGHRKYNRLLVLNECINLYIKLPKSIGIHVTSLHLDCWEVTVYEIKKVIELCPNIKELSLMYLVRNRIPEEITKKEEIPLAKLDRFSVQGELQIFKCLKNLQVKELIIYRQSDLTVHHDELSDFIINQKHMTNLEIYHMYFISSLFFRDEMKHVAFRLNRLIIKYSTDFRYFCFGWFAESQKDSIKFVSVDDFGYDMIKFLTSFKEMKTFKLTLKESSPTEHENDIGLWNVQKSMLLPQVEDLEIENYGHNAIHHFPNVRKLKIIGNDLELNLWYCYRLETLTVVTRNLKKQLQMHQSVRKLTLIMYEYPKDRGPFHWNSIKLEELTLIGAKNLDWFAGFLEKLEMNLKKLRIERCDLTDEHREMLKIHGNKIDMLEIIEQDGQEIEALTKRYI